MADDPRSADDRAVDRAGKLQARLGAERQKRRDLAAKLEGERQRIRSLRTRLDDAERQIAELRRTVASQLETRERLRAKIQAMAWRPGYARSPRYAATRRRFFEHCLAEGRLGRDGAVLDVGCGIGGVAEELARYLDDEARYEGFDVAPQAIEFAREIVAPSHRGFRFEVADVFNSKYNPEGRYQPDEYRFPFDDDTFDLTILRSVFTHMLPPEVDNYLGEVARTLKPGGRCLITYMLVDEDSLPHISESDTEGFPYDHGIYRLSDPDVVEARVALDRDWVMSRYERHGLEVIPPLLLGSWRDADDDGLDGQDLVTAEKPAAAP